MLQIAFSWLLSKPVIASVIAGASTPEQLRANVAALGWQIDTAEMEMVNRISSGRVYA